MKPTAKVLKDHLINVIDENSKTTYGKKELVLFIQEQYADLLERYLED